MRPLLWVHDSAIASALLWCIVNGGWTEIAWILSWALLTGVTRVVDPFGYRDTETILWVLGLTFSAQFVLLMIFWKPVVDWIVMHY